MNVKTELAKKAGNTGRVKLTKNMAIADMIKALEPAIARALPSVITPERFTRMALNALNNTPKLAECTQMSFLGALMSTAQLGLEPNTPLGQAYLIPYKNKGVLECQFQIGYKGLLDLIYRNDMVQTVQAQTVYEHDEFRVIPLAVIIYIKVNKKRFNQCHLVKPVSTGFTAVLNFRNRYPYVTQNSKNITFLIIPDS